MFDYNVLFKCLEIQDLVYIRLILAYELTSMVSKTFSLMFRRVAKQRAVP